MANVHNGGYILNQGAGASTWSTTAAGGAGSASGTYTIGTNGTSASSISNGSNTLLTVPYGGNTVQLEKNATLEVKGTVKINGIDLEERLKTIESVLMIPERDAILEAKYPNLKKKYDEYIAALGKYRTFETIKGEE